MQQADSARAVAAPSTSGDVNAAPSTSGDVNAAPAAARKKFRRFKTSTTAPVIAVFPENAVARRKIAQEILRPRTTPTGEPRNRGALCG
jgi:hypothetical protein